MRTIGWGVRSTLSPTTPLLGGAPAVLRGACGLCGATHEWANDVALGELALAQLFSDLGPDVAPGLVTGLVTGLVAGPALTDDRRRLLASPGKMIGVLVVEDAHGDRQTLRAFSGDLGGQEQQPGWVDSVVRRADTAALQTETWAALAVLDDSLTTATPSEHTRLRAQRRALSRRLMAAMVEATHLTNRAGVTAALPTVFVGKGIPSGTADCVLPKLLVSANQRGLRPLAFAEAWWGPTQGDRRHGVLQQPCLSRCQPVLGFLLCDKIEGARG